MSKINDINPHFNDRKKSNIMIISKNRISTEKDVSNYMTVFEGNKKITCEIGKENIKKTKINKAFSTLKETILKYSNSTGKLNTNIINIYPKRNKLNISVNTEKVYQKPNDPNINTIETCHGLITNENKNKDIQVIENDTNTIEKENKNNKNNNEIDEDEDSFDFNLKGLKIVNIEEIYDKNINNNNNDRNVISQNYFKNIKKIRERNVYDRKWEIYKSEEIKRTFKRSDKAEKSISDHISKLNENIQIIESERSENKKSIILNLNKRNKINNNIIKSLISEERELNTEEKEKEREEEKERDYKSNIQSMKDEDYYNCRICEYSYIESAMFLPECNIHYLCKRCTKNYYEEIIDEGNKELFCPFLQCKKGVNIEKLKTFISDRHYMRLCSFNQNLENLEENKLILSRLKTDYNKDNFELYSKKHVIDINSNKNFYKYKGCSDNFCPFCSEKTLFTQTNNYFYRCLNCLTKVCKFCFKEINNNRHFDMNNPGRCKVFHRFISINEKQNNCLLVFLLQLFFVIVLYYFTFIGTFISLRDTLFNVFDVNKKRNCFGCIFIYCFTIIIFILLIPFIIIIFPYFPSISAVFDYY
jgi:hypothetical protein